MGPVLVTGAATGLGREIASVLGKEAAGLVLVDLPGSAVGEVAEELGGTAVEVDVTDEPAVEAALRALPEPPSVVVNNAGVVGFGPLLDTGAAEFRRVVDVNLTGTMIVSTAAVRRMAGAGGVIVNVSSLNGAAPVPNSGAYGASKAAVAQLTQMMAVEWAPLGVRVNAVAPGLIDSGMSARLYADPRHRDMRSASIPLGRLGGAGDVAAAVAFLAGPGSSYITGQTVLVDGGVSLLAVAGLPPRT